MLCPHCSREIPLACPTCPFCAQPLLSTDAISTSASAAPRENSTLRILAGVGALLCSVAVVLLAAFVTRRTYGRVTSEAIGYFVGRCIGAFLLPLIGILLYAKYSKTKSAPANLAFACCAFALLFSIMATIGSVASFRPASDAELKEHIATLAKEGTGQRKITGEDGQWDGVMRAFFADIKQFNDEYTAEVAKLDNSALEKMYGSDSYNGDANVSRTLAQLQATLAVEDKYASMEPLLQKTKERVFASSASDEEKQAFWGGFESSARKNLQLRTDVNAKERAWLEASIGLYEFMKAGESSYHVKNDKVIFNSDGSLNSYNEKMKSVDTLRQEFLSARDAFLKAQKEGLGQMGLNPSDFDAPTNK